MPAHPRPPPLRARSRPSPGARCVDSHSVGPWPLGADLGISWQLPASVPRPPSHIFLGDRLRVCEGGAVSHSSDLIQLKFNLRVTNLSQRSPTRRWAPLCRRGVLPGDPARPNTSPPPAPASSFAVSVGQPWGLACCPAAHPSSPVLRGRHPIPATQRPEWDL